MNRSLTIFTLALLTVLPVKGEDLPKFSITLTVDSAIASQPQQVYLYSQIEREMTLHDSISIDSVHRQGTLHGTVPYEYNVNLMFSRRGPAIVPVYDISTRWRVRHRHWSTCAIISRWTASAI